jgi:hypothetical protein
VKIRRIVAVAVIPRLLTGYNTPRHVPAFLAVPDNARKTDIVEKGLLKRED